MKTKKKPDKAYRQEKYSHGEQKRAGKHRTVTCKHCKAKTRSDKLGRHIGLMHSEKATKKQREAAKQSRAKKWWCCDICNATMNEANKARHLKVCTGRAVQVESRATGVRKLVPRGPKAKTLEILGLNFLIGTKVEAKFEAMEGKSTQEARQRKWQRN